MVALAAAVEGGLLTAAIVVGSAVGVPPLSHFQLTLSGVGGGTVATVPLLLLLAWSLRTQWPPMVRLVAVMRDHVAPLFAGCSLTQLACIAALAGLGEEMFFRGVLQAGLAQRVSVGVAVAIGGAAFGLIHFLTPTYAALATVVGCYLGGLFAVFDNLLIPVTTHAVYDFIALTVLSHLRSDRHPAVA